MVTRIHGERVIIPAGSRALVTESRTPARYTIRACGMRVAGLTFAEVLERVQPA